MKNVNLHIKLKVKKKSNEKRMDQGSVGFILENNIVWVICMKGIYIAAPRIEIRAKFSTNAFFIHTKSQQE
jgi:hypothetical protein